MPWLVTGSIGVIAGLFVMILFWPTFRSMINAWSSSRTFTHGFLVLPAAGYLVWCHRHRLSSLVPTPNSTGLLGLVFAAGGWVAGSRLHLPWLEQASVVMMLLGLAWALLGTEIFCVLAWPLGFLLFMLPVGTALEPWLQDVTAWLILAGLQVTGIPFSYDQYRISIPSGTWHVVPDCGGLRYLLPGTALSYAFATLVYQQPIRRIAFMVVCAAALMLANGIRAYGIIAGDHFGIAEGADHRVFSYTIYGLTLPMLYWLGLKWTDSKPIAPSRADTGVVPQTYDVRKIVIMAVTAVVLLAIVPLSLSLGAALQ